MTTVEAARGANQTISNKLLQLRGKLRQWVSVRGLGRWLWSLLAVLAVDMALDRLFKMDFAQRAIVLVLIVGTVLYLFYRWFWLPFSRPISDERLLKQVEDRNRQTRENVIASFELSKQSEWAERGVSAGLAERTIATGHELAKKLDFNSILDLGQYRKNLAVLCGALALVFALAIGVSQINFLGTWFKRNLLLTNDQWPQDTYLSLVGAVDGTLVLPRGADHRQLVEVLEESRYPNVEVTLEMENTNGLTMQKMKPTGRLAGREHAFVFHSIASEYRIRARGGDATTDWVNIQLVEPPAVLETVLTAKLPEYTGAESQTFSGSGPHRVLNGSQIEVEVRANKPLRSCELVWNDTTLTMEPSTPERETYRISLGANTALEGGKYKLALIDDSNLNNIREFSFEIRLTEDSVPVVRGQMLGISGLIVPRARVPISYSAEDDFGLTKLGFECSWSNDTTDGSNEISLPIENWAVRPPQKEVSDVAVLEIERLKLEPETSLRVLLAAADNQIPTAGRGVSREFLLRIVTDEELRADLLRREIEQRKSFQQAYDSQMEMVSEMRELMATPAEGTSNADWQTQRQNRLVNLYRSQRGIGTSVDLIAKRFEEFLVEVHNNRLDEEVAKIDPERTLTQRFENEIIIPIRAMDETMISLAAQNIDNCRRNFADEVAFRTSVMETVDLQEAILERMRAIMESMESSESFQDTVNRAVEIKRFEEAMRKQLESKGSTKGVFDDE